MLRAIALALRARLREANVASRNLLDRAANPSLAKEGSRVSLFFLEFNYQWFARGSRNRPVSDCDRPRRIDGATADVVGDVGGVTQELNFLDVGRMQLCGCSIGSNGQRQSIRTVHVGEHSRNLFAFDRWTYRSESLQNCLFSFPVR